jgi:Glycosyltransferase
MKVHDKKILVDLIKLKKLNCGLGQVAFHQGHELGKQTFPGLDIHLLTPQDFIGHFGNKVKYLSTGFLNRTFSFLNSGFDLWHATHQGSPFMPASSKTPYLLTIHDLNYLYEKSPAKIEKYHKRLQARVDRACMIVAISEYTAADIRKHLDVKGKEIRVIHNGVQFHNFEQTERPSFINAERPFLFTIGQVVAKKNFHSLVDMMRHFPEYDLFICGENKSDYAAQIAQQIEKEQITNVKLTGAISSSEKNWMYQNCRAFVFPSKFEGFGLPVIEAMQCGKPVFSSEMTSLKEIGGEYAFFWNNFEPEYMAQIVREGLTTFDSTPSWAENEQKYALEFSYEKHIQAYISLYKEILGL